MRVSRDHTPLLWLLWWSWVVILCAVELAAIWSVMGR